MDKQIIPLLDLVRAWVYNPETLGGHFVYPLSEHLHPTAAELGDFWYDVNKKIKEGKEVSISRWSRWTTPTTVYSHEEAQPLYDGDIVRIHWKISHRDIIARYRLDYHQQDGQWVFRELGKQPNREYIALVDVLDLEKEFISMEIVGHAWEPKWRNVTANVE